MLSIPKGPAGKKLRIVLLKIAVMYLVRFADAKVKQRELSASKFSACLGRLVDEGQVDRETEVKALEVILELAGEDVETFLHELQIPLP